MQVINGEQKRDFILCPRKCINLVKRNTNEAKGRPILCNKRYRSCIYGYSIKRAPYLGDFSRLARLQANYSQGDDVTAIRSEGESWPYFS